MVHCVVCMQLIYCVVYKSQYNGWCTSHVLYCVWHAANIAFLCDVWLAFSIVVYNPHCWLFCVQSALLQDPHHVWCDVQLAYIMRCTIHTCHACFAQYTLYISDVHLPCYTMWCTTYNICYVGIIHLLCCVMYDPHCTLCNGQHTFTRYCILHCALPRYLVLYAVHIVYRAAYSPLHIVRCTTHIVVMHESHSVQCVVRPTLYAV